MANGHGGTRSGAGRKTKAAVEQRKDVQTDPVFCQAAAEALELHVAILSDSDKPIKMRLECAREVMDRVWGKPAQRQNVDMHQSGEVTLVVRRIKQDSLLGFTGLASPTRDGGA